MSPAAPGGCRLGITALLLLGCGARAIDSADAGASEEGANTETREGDEANADAASEPHTPAASSAAQELPPGSAGELVADSAIPSIYDSFRGPAQPNGCTWGLNQWLAELDTSLSAAQDCDPVTRPEGTTVAAQVECFLNAAGNSGTTGTLSLGDSSPDRQVYQLHVRTDDDRELYVYVDDSATTLDARQVRIDECSKFSDPFGTGNVCASQTQIYACKEGRDVVDEMALASGALDLARLESDLDAARKRAAASGLTPVGRQRTTTTAPLACHSQVPIPPIGCDPNNDLTWAVDCDQDGVAGYVAVDCTSSVVRADTYAFERDCDDADPSLQVWAVEDRDADGHGVAPGGELFCSPSAIPTGYGAAQAASDCDDEVSTSNPGADDLWADELDSDCDGTDHPSCRELREGIEVAALVPTQTACKAQADLYIAPIASCGRGFNVPGGHFVYVANRGAMAFDGRAQLRWQQYGQEQRIEIPSGLAAGATTPLFAFDGSAALQIVLTDEQGNALADCTSADEQRSASAVVFRGPG